MLLEKIKLQLKGYIKKRVKEEVIRRIEAHKKELSVNMVYIKKKKYKRALYNKEEALIKAMK